MRNPVQKDSPRECWHYASQTNHQNGHQRTGQVNINQRLKTMKGTFQVLPLARNGNWPSQPPKKCGCPNPVNGAVNVQNQVPGVTNGQNRVQSVINVQNPVQGKANVQNGNLNTCTCGTCPLGDVPYDVPCQCAKQTEVSRAIQTHDNSVRNIITNEVNVQNENLNSCTCDTCPLGDVPYDVPCQCAKRTVAPQAIQQNYKSAQSRTADYNPNLMNGNVRMPVKKCGCPTPVQDAANVQNPVRNAVNLQNPMRDAVNVQNKNNNSCTCETCPLGDVPYDVPCQCAKLTQVPKVAQQNNNSSQNGTSANEQNGNTKSCTCATCPLGDVPYDVPCQCTKLTQVPKAIQQSYNSAQNETTVNMQMSVKKCGCPNSVQDAVNVKNPVQGTVNVQKPLQRAVNVQNDNINSCTCETCPLGDVPYDVPCQCAKLTQVPRAAQQNNNSSQNGTTANVQNGNTKSCTCETCPLGDVPYDVPCQCTKLTHVPKATPLNYNSTKNGTSVNMQMSVKKCGCPNPVQDAVNVKNPVQGTVNVQKPLQRAVNVRNDNINSCTCETCPLGDVPYDVPCQCAKLTQDSKGAQQNNNSSQSGTTANVQNGNTKSCTCETCPLGDVPYDVPCKCTKLTQAPKAKQQSYNSAQNGTTVNVQMPVKRCGCPNSVQDAVNVQHPMQGAVNVQNENINTSCTCKTSPLGDVPYDVSCQCNNLNKPKQVPKPVKDTVNTRRPDKKCSCPNALKQANVRNKTVGTCKCEKHALGDVPSKDPCQCPQPIQKNNNSAKIETTNRKPIKDKVNKKTENRNTCKCETCPLDDVRYETPCQCNEPQEDSISSSRELSDSSDSSSLPDDISVGQDDVAYVEKIRQLLENEKKLNKEIDDLGRAEKKLVKRKKDESGSGDYEINALKRLNEKLEENNQILETEIEEITANIKYLKENMEEPMKKEIEKEKKKIRDLEEEFRLQQGSIEKERVAQRKKIDTVRKQLEDANQYLSELYNVNKSLKEELCILNCRCNELQTDIVHQKLSEIHTISRLYAQKRRAADNVASKHSKGSSDGGDGRGGGKGGGGKDGGKGGGDQTRLEESRRSSSRSCSCTSSTDTIVCPTDKPCPSKQGRHKNDLDVIAQNLSTLLVQASENNTCQCINADLIDTVKYIKDLIDMLNGSDESSASSSESLPCECKPDVDKFLETPDDNQLQDKEYDISSISSDECRPSGVADDTISGQDLINLLLEYLDSQLDEKEQILVDEENKPITADCGCPIEINDDDDDDACSCSIVDEVEKIASRVCGDGKPMLAKTLSDDEDSCSCFDELDRPMTPVEIPIGDVKCSCTAIDSKPVLDKTDAVLTAAASITGEEGHPVSPEELPIEEEEDRPVSPEELPIEEEEDRPVSPEEEDHPVSPEEDDHPVSLGEEAPIEEIVDDNQKADAVEDEKPILEVEPVENPCECGGIQIICPPRVKPPCEVGDETLLNVEGKPLTGEGLPADMMLDEQEKPVLDEQGSIVAVPVQPEEQVRPLDETGKPVLDATLDEQGHVVPTGIQIDESGKPIVDAEGHMLTPSDHVLPTGIQMDASDKPIVDAGGPMVAASDHILPAGIPMDESGKPIVGEQGPPSMPVGTPVDAVQPIVGVPTAADGVPLDVEQISGQQILDKDARLFGQDGTPIDVLVDEHGPVLDSEGALSGEGGVDLVPLPEAEALAVPTPDEEPVIISRSTDGDYVTTAAASGDELHVTTEGPAGLIDTTVRMTDSGTLQIRTDMTEFEEEPLTEEQSLSPTDVASEDAGESIEGEGEAESIGVTYELGEEDGEYDRSTTEESEHDEIVEQIPEHEITSEEEGEVVSSLESIASSEGEGVDMSMPPLSEIEQEEMAEIKEIDMSLPPICEMEEISDDAAKGDEEVETLMPPVAEMEESKEALAIEGEEIKPCICKSDKACQCQATGDQACQCEDEVPDEEKAGDQEVDLGIGDREDVDLSTGDLEHDKDDTGDGEGEPTTDTQICKPDICASGERGGDVPWPCECMKPRTLCEECANKPSDKKPSKIQVDITISCEQPKSENDQDKSKSSALSRGVCADTCRNIGIQQNENDLPKSVCTKTTCKDKSKCPVLSKKDTAASVPMGIIYKDKGVDSVLENKINTTSCCPCLNDTSIQRTSEPVSTCACFSDISQLRCKPCNRRPRSEKLGNVEDDREIQPPCGICTAQSATGGNTFYGPPSTMKCDKINICCSCSKEVSATDSILMDPSCNLSICEERDKLTKPSADTSSQCLKSCTCIPESVSTMGSLDVCIPNCVKALCKKNDIYKKSSNSISKTPKAEPTVDTACAPKICKVSADPSRPFCTSTTCKKRRRPSREGDVGKPTT